MNVYDFMINNYLYYDSDEEFRDECNRTLKLERQDKINKHKEEKRNENSNIHAFDMGYKKAQSAVLDANITTLISAIILFFLGSGPVKGFAVTIGIGIVTTLFSAYFFARHLSSYYVLKNKDKDISI